MPLRVVQLRSHVRKSVLAVWTVAFAVRCAVLAVSWQGAGARNLTPDSSRYLSLADSFAGQAGFSLPAAGGTPTPEYLTLPPYPLLLMGFEALGAESVLPALVAQCAATALAAAALFAVVARTAGFPAGVIAGLLLSLDVQSVAYSNLVLTDALGMALVSFAFVALLGYLERRSMIAACVAGLASGAALFLRPANLVLILIVAAAAVAATVGRDRGRALAHLPAMLVLAFSPVLAWSVRNHALSGMWFYTTSPDVILVRWQLPRLYAEAHGTSLESAREAVASRLGIEDIYPRLGVEPPTFRPKARALARELVAAHGAAFLRLQLAGVARVAGQPDGSICQLLGQPIGESGLARGGLGVREAFRRRWGELGWGSRLLYFGQLPYLGCLWLLAALGAWTGLRQPRLRGAVALLVLGVASFVLTSGGYPGDPRYRLPAVPLLVVLASLGAHRLHRLHRLAGLAGRREAD